MGGSEPTSEPRHHPARETVAAWLLLGWVVVLGLQYARMVVATKLPGVASRIAVAAEVLRR